MKIFRRIEEVAEVKKKESDEGDSTSTGSSTEGEDEETLRQRRMKLDPKVCPEGLSKEIYQLAFTLRDKRAEIEEKVAIQKGEIGALMLAFEEVDKEKRKTDENLKEAQENIAKAERSKRSSLDNVESVVPLTLEQFDARVYNDNFQWAECGPFLDVDLLQVEEEEQDEIVEEEEKVEDEEEQLIIKEKKVEEKIEEWADEQAEEEGEEKKSKDSKTEVIPRPDETLDIDEGVLVSSKQLWELRQREDVIRKHIEEEEEKYREDKEDLEEMRRENRKLERELLKRKQQLQEKMIATVGAVFPVELGHTALLVSALEKVRTKAHVEGHNYEQELKKLEIEKRIHRDNLSRLLQENTDKLYCLSVLEEMNLRAECAENVLARTQPKPTVDTDSKYEKEVHKLQRRIKRQHQEMLLLRQEIKTLSLKTKGPPPLVRKTPQPPPKLLKESSSVSSTLEPLGPDQENVSVTMVLGEEFVVEEILTEELGEGEKEEEEADKGEQYLPEPGVTEERQEDTEEESDIIPVDDIIMQIIQSIPFIESDVPEFLDRVVDELETTEAETHVKSILDDVIHELNVPLEENEGLEEKFSVVLDQIDRSSKSKEHIEEVRSILQDVILKSTQVADTSDEGQSDLEDEVKPQTEEPSDELE
ncbi:golgin subfamily A member 6-like protein 22 isoform X2 [Anabrus simplex]